MVRKRSIAFAVVGFAVLTGSTAGATRSAAASAPCEPPTAFCATVVVTSTHALGWTPGTGRVTSDPPGLDCFFVDGIARPACQHTFDVPSAQPPADSVQGKLTLTFTAAELSLVQSRSGDVAPSRALDADVSYSQADPTVTVDSLGFVVLKHRLDVRTIGRGGDPPPTGKVTGPEIDCGNVCTAALDHGRVVELTATAGPGSVFTGWEGACRPQEGQVCRLTMTTDLATDATFGPPPPSGPPGTGPPSTPTKPLRGELISAKPAWSKSGARLVIARLTLEDEASGTLTLTRGGKAVATKALSAIAPGRYSFTLAVAPRVPAGRVLLSVDLTGTEGARILWVRSVVLPKARRR